MTSASTYSNTIEDIEQPISSIALPNQPLPAFEAGYWLHGDRPHPDQIVVITGQDALRQVHEHGRSNVAVELGGALLGRAYQADGQLIVHVQAALPARVSAADHSPIHFTFTADAWSQLHRDKDEQYPDLAIIGWFHTHPDLGVFYSADDVVVHSAAFVLPWHVGLVLDPVRQEACFFAWDRTITDRQEIIPLTGFYEQLDSQPQSVVNWRVAQGLSWMEAEEMLGRVGRVFTPAPVWPALPPISPWWGVLLGGLSLLISLLLLIERLV
jgi:proteasome lid subunit RPN8/RPN11